MERLVSEFNRYQDEYRVTMKRFGDWSSSPDIELFENGRQSNTLPDLLGLENHHIPDLAYKDQLVPLNERLDTGAFDLFREEAIDVCTYDGDRYGLPISTNLAFLCANRRSITDTVFDPEIPSDLPSFTEGIREIDRTDVLGFVPTYPGWWPHVWPWLFDGGWYNETGAFTPASESNVKAYEWALSFRGREAASKFGEVINPIRSPPEPFFDGDVAFVFDGEHLVHRLTKNDVNWTIAPLPTKDGSGRVYLTADVLSIPRGAAEIEGALAFLVFLAEKSRLEQLAVDHQKSSPTRDWSTDFLENHPNPHIRPIESLLQSVPIVHDPITPGWLERREKIENVVKMMWTGERSVIDALDSLNP